MRKMEISSGIEAWQCLKGRGCFRFHPPPQTNCYEFGIWYGKIQVRKYVLNASSIYLYVEYNDFLYNPTWKMSQDNNVSQGFSMA